MKASAAASAHLALLRGINLGGKNKLPMADLRALFEDAGCSEVETHIQSGNVVFRLKNSLARGLPARIENAIASEFGFRVPVVMRTGSELRSVARRNPFLCEDADLKSLHVAFLADTPEAARANELDPDRSKLTNKHFDSRLQTTSTLRNWNTVLRLCEMVDRAGG